MSAGACTTGCLFITLSAAVQSAGVRQRVSADSNVVRNIPVNTDMYLVKAQHNVPADEKFFYRLVINFLHCHTVLSLKVYKLVCVGYVLLGWRLMELSGYEEFWYVP